MVWVKAHINPKLYIKVPGNIICLWGHDFEIQQDGTLCMEVHPDFVDAGVKAGRFSIMTAPPPGKEKSMEDKIKIIKPNIPVGFTMDVGNYYGAGDLNKLIDKISAFKRTDLVEFAAQRFTDTPKIKANLKKRDILDKIRSLIDSAMLDELSKEE